LALTIIIKIIKKKITNNKLKMSSSFLSNSLSLNKLNIDGDTDSVRIGGKTLTQLLENAEEGPEGPQGPQGPQGQEGPQGPQGQPGDLSDYVSKIENDQIITGNNLRINQTNSNLDSSYGLYIKKIQPGTESLTGTCRTLLVENHVNSNGSGNPTSPNFAHNTISSRYTGSGADLSIAVTGVYNEAFIENSASSIIAQASFNMSESHQLGVNTGSINIAENAGTSNTGSVSFGSISGAVRNVGATNAIADTNFESFVAYRQLFPYPPSLKNIALIADAKDSTEPDTKALYVAGNAVISRELTFLNSDKTRSVTLDYNTLTTTLGLPDAPFPPP